MTIPGVDSRTFDERNQALRDRWPQEHKPSPNVSHVKGDGGSLSNLTVMAGLENQGLFIGLDQFVYDGQGQRRRRQIGLITQEHLPDLLRQMCLAFSVHALSAAMEAIIKKPELRFRICRKCGHQYVGADFGACQYCGEPTTKQQETQQ